MRTSLCLVVLLVIGAHAGQSKWELLDESEPVDSTTVGEADTTTTSTTTTTGATIEDSGRNTTSSPQQKLCTNVEGRPGKCVARGNCSTVQDNSDLEVCYRVPGRRGRMVDFVCCPSSDRPGATPSPVTGNIIQVQRTFCSFCFHHAGCGMRPSVSPIVGGYDAEPNSWPWQVALFQRGKRDPTKHYFICGGSILNRRFILTAAHCVVRDDGPLKPEMLSVKVGAHDVTDSTSRRIPVSAVIAHENYKQWKVYNDIALLRLDEDLDFTDPAIRPVCVQTQDMAARDYANENSTIIGWGTTKYLGDLAKNLQEAEIPIVSNEECNANYSTIEGAAQEFPNGIDQSMICAGVAEGGKGNCHGDSGGPLLYQQDGHWIQLGIVSFGYKCAEAGYPTVSCRGMSICVTFQNNPLTQVYSRVLYFLKWIGSHVEEFS